MVTSSRLAAYLAYAKHPYVLTERASPFGSWFLLAQVWCVFSAAKAAHPTRSNLNLTVPESDDGPLQQLTSM